MRLKRKFIRLSAHQRKVILEMRLTGQLNSMFIRTNAILEKHGLIYQRDYQGKWLLTDLGQAFDLEADYTVLYMHS